MVKHVQSTKTFNLTVYHYRKYRILHPSGKGSSRTGVRGSQGAYNMGALSLGGYSLGLPILDLPNHVPVLCIDWGLQSGGLESLATDFGSAKLLTCALHRLGAYSLGAYSLGLPILDLPDLLPVLYKDYRGPFNENVV